MVRVPERQQPKTQAQFGGFPAEDIDGKTCRKRQVLADPGECGEAEKLAAVQSFYHAELADKSKGGDKRNAQKA
jgi:hypothetical protein